MAISLLAAMPSAAAAAAPSAAPTPRQPGGAPGLNQYNETLPGPRGDKSVSKIRPRPETNLPQGPTRALQSQGQPGAVAAALAAATKPQRAHHRRHVARSGAVARVLDGSGGLGALFPILLALIVLALALALAVRRRLARPRADHV